MEDLISVIIPVYNVEKYIDRCMESVFKQTYKNLEIILVDDKSNDGSNEKCLTYKFDHRVVVVHGENKGLSGARNSGLDIAKGKYVVFIDSDDYAEPTMIDNLYQCAQKTGADTVIGGFRRQTGNKIDIKNNEFAGIIYDTHDDIKNKVLKKMLASDGHTHIEMSVWKTLFSMDIISKNNLRFPDRKYLCEDIIFDFGYFMLAEKVVMSNDTGYCYCLNENSLSQMYQKKKFDRIEFQVSEMKRLANSVGFDQEAFLRIDNFFIGNLIHHIKSMIACIDKVGRLECRKEIYRICTNESVKKVNWKAIRLCYKGRDMIPYVLMKNNRQLILYYYLKLLIQIRNLVRGN